jgi:phosphoenolpyruvate---glycerone phosphotransferase subunit DhaL
MTERVERDELGRMFSEAAERIRAECQLLSDLDSVCGDGDHGTTMLRTMERLESSTAPSRPGDMKTILRDAGWNVLDVDGGASSSLLGTFFGGMSDAPIGTASLDCAALAAAFEAGLKSVARQTKAAPGDKTMMDALVPAVQALRVAADSGKCISEALQAAAAAARAGAESTKNLTARYGRAKHLGEKTRGCQDPGATSIALIFDGFARAVAESTQGVRNARH